jgi:hypothetical protein
MGLTRTLISAQLSAQNEQDISDKNLVLFHKNLGTDVYQRMGLRMGAR